MLDDKDEFFSSSRQAVLQNLADDFGITVERLLMIVVETKARMDPFLLQMSVGVPEAYLTVEREFNKIMQERGLKRRSTNV